MKPQLKLEDEISIQNQDTSIVDGQEGYAEALVTLRKSIDNFMIFCAHINDPSEPTDAELSRHIAQTASIHKIKKSRLEWAQFAQDALDNFYKVVIEYDAQIEYMTRSELSTHSAEKPSSREMGKAPEGDAKLTKENLPKKFQVVIAGYHARSTKESLRKELLEAIKKALTKE